MDHFCLYSGLGTFLWTAMLTYAGQQVGEQYEQVGNVTGAISWIVIAILAGSWLFMIVRRRRQANE